MPDFRNLINKVKTKYLERLEDIDPEYPDWENYHPPHTGYIEEWEAYELATEQEVDAVFKKFKKKATKLILQQKHNHLLALVSGIFFACQEVETDNNSEFFEDIHETFFESFNDSLASVIEKTEQSVIPGNVNSAIELFLSFCDQIHPAEIGLPEFIEPLLISLAEKSIQPAQLLEAIDNSKIKRKDVPQLVLKLNKNCGNHSEWLKSAEKYYKTNAEIAKQLIDYYFKNDQSRYLARARELFKTDKTFWAEYLKNSITYELNEQLYIDVFYELYTFQKNIKYYQKIHNYLTFAQKEKLLAEIAYNPRLKVEILTVEKRFEDIKDVVTENTNSWDFKHLVSPIIKIYPEFCFNAIKQQVTSTIATERGRHIYEGIVKNIKLAKKITGFEIQTRQLIMELYNHKPNLPALKDEFRIGGLV